jgi:hypothetical protein
MPDALLVVDQSASEASRAVVEGCSIPGSRYVEQPRLGLSASRNLALELCSTSLLAVTDDDCVPEPGWVQGILSGFGRDPIPDVVTGPVLALGPQTPGTHAISMRPDAPPRDHSGRVVPWPLGSGGNSSARRALLLDHGGWDIRLGAGSPGMAAEDAELLYRLMREGSLVRYEPAAVVRHERQSRERLLATGYSYAFGTGALCGLWLRRGDPFAIRMAVTYARDHIRGLARSARHGDRDMTQQHVRALLGLMPGVLYGLRA